MKLGLLCSAAALAVVTTSTLVIASPANDDVCTERKSDGLTQAAEDVRQEALAFINPDSRSGALIEDLKTLGERNGQYDEIYLKDDVDALAKAFVNGLIPFAAVPFVLFIISCLACPCFTIARCCCAKSCCAGSGGPYTPMQKWAPLVFYLVFATIAMGLAFGGVYQIGTAVAGLVGSVCEVESLSSNTTSFFNEFIDPIQDLRGEVQVTVPKVASILNDTSDVVTGVVELGASISNFSTSVITAFGDIPVNENVTAPDVLTNADTEINEINTEIQDGLEVVVNDLDEIKDQVNSNIVDAKNDLDDVLVQASNSISNISDSVTSVIDPFTETAKEVLGNYVQYTERASYAFFSIVFVAFVAGVLTAITAVTPTKCDDSIGYVIFTLSWFLTYLFMLLMFLLSGVILPVSIVASDACAVVVDLPTDLEAWVEAFSRISTYQQQGHQPQIFRRRLQFGEDVNAFDLATSLIDNCFSENPSPVLESLNITNEFKFDEYFKQLEDGFTNGVQIEDATTLTEMEDYNTQIQSTPEVDVTNIQLLVDEVNSKNTIGNITIAGCTPTDGCDKQCLRDGSCEVQPSELEGPRDAIIDAADTANQYNQVVASMKADFPLIVDQADEVGELANGLNNKTQEAFDNVKPLLKIISNVDQLGDCGFIAARYYGITDELCARAIGNVNSLAVTCLVIGICAIPILVCSVLVSNRVFNYTESKYANMYSNRNLLAGSVAGTKNHEQAPLAEAIPVDEHGGKI